MYEFLWVLAVVVIIALAVALYEKSTNAICVSKRRLDGQTVIVTGGTAGMGLHIATDLAHRGARVIIAGRIEDKGTCAKNQIVQETGNENVVFKLLDLASLKSVRQFAADVLNNEERLDILLNNAGVVFTGDFLTADGMNFIMQVNYFGTFLLTILLLTLLKKTGKQAEPSRILVTASVLHMLGRVDIDNLNRTNYWNCVQIYANSKISLVLFAHELTKRLKGSNVVINTVDPGAVGTRIYNSLNIILATIITTVFYLFFKTPWEGAQTALHAALNEKAGDVSGAYFRNCKIVRAVDRAYCDKTAKELWDESVRFVKLTEDEVGQCLNSS